MKLTILRGIPASGKSSYIKLHRSLHPNDVIVCRDDIRFAIYGRYTDVNEDVITAVEGAAIRSAMKNGLNCVVDATHIKHAYIKRVWEIGETFGATVEVKDFPIDLNEALKRNAARERQVPEDVIRRMHQALKSSGEYVHKPVAQPEFYVPDADKPKAIIVDLDGTIAIFTGHRGPFDFNKVDQDEVNYVVKDVVDLEYAAGTHIIVMSGRDDSCQELTEAWLAEHDIPYDEIHMRRTGDQRNDSIVKGEMFDEFVRDQFDVKYCLDDRDRVVEFYRSIGLVVLQVAPGNF